MPAPIPNIPPQQRLTPSQVRSLCRALQIPLDEFGLTLDDFDHSFGRYEDKD
ncbi:MAG TPA: hypothetical protein VKK81_04340 [Candidatus Binatia bacterium]|nr:hypothetical protein [Candidatus Binatia bacterium]